MSAPGLVAVVSADPTARAALTRALEGEGFAVLALHDCAELLELVEQVRRRPGTLRLVAADASVGCAGVLEVAAWARLAGLEVPFLLFAERADERTRDLARAVGGVRVVEGSSLVRARAAVRALLER